MFCCNLAKVLTAGKQKALIINADSSTPMLPVWMPERILETGASIGNVLTGLEINNALVAERVVILKEYPFIGVMGYAAGENPFSYPELKYEKSGFYLRGLEACGLHHIGLQLQHAQLLYAYCD